MSIAGDRAKRQRQRASFAALAILFLLSTWAVAAAPLPIDDPTAVTSLAVPWKFRAGDDPGWAAPDLDDADWREVRIPTGFGRRDAESAFAWYRLELDLAPGGRTLSAADRIDFRLGLTIGKVDSAYEVFAGGRRLGGVGSLPPQPRLDYDRHGLYRVPWDAVAADGRLEIALRVWKAKETRSSVGGPHEGPFLVGELEELTRHELVSELPALFLGGWFMILSLVHLELYRRRPALRGYLWFALLCASFAGYAFLRTQWKYSLTERFVLLKELEHVDLYLGLTLFIQVVWPLIGLPIGKLLRAVQAASLAAALVVAIPGLRPNLILLPFWQLTVLVVNCAVAWSVFREARRRNPEARIVALGAVVVILGFVFEVGVDRGFYSAPRLANFGFAFFVTSLALSLANQFVRVYAELEALRRSERAAERASRAKSEFLANMSHEIRTPMTGILGAADLLLKEELAPKAREHGRIIRSSARSLLGIIDGILDFSKVESGRLELEMTELPLRRTVDGVVQLLGSRARAKGIELRLILDPALPAKVVGDPLRLRQILINLVANGIKFTPRGEVTLQVEVEKQGPEEIWLRFTVRDTGIGIEKESREQLFLPFTQADSSTTRRFGGTGLGLAISQKLVELMGGRIELESEPGEGSTFTFSSRFSPAGGRPAGEEEPPPPAASRRVAGPYRVLLAEDNPIIQVVVAEQLRVLGLTVVVAGNGRQALEILEQEEFDLVLMDCQMPEIDGYETTRRIRQQEIGGQHLPVVALTAHAMEGDREKCLEAGMDDYLPKPFSDDQIGSVLERWLAAD